MNEASSFGTSVYETYPSFRIGFGDCAEAARGTARRAMVRMARAVSRANLIGPPVGSDARNSGHSRGNAALTLPESRPRAPDSRLGSSAAFFGEVKFAATAARCESREVSESGWGLCGPELDTNYAAKGV
jgi:hypothetical protein